MLLYVFQNNTGPRALRACTAAISAAAHFAVYVSSSCTPSAASTCAAAAPAAVGAPYPAPRYPPTMSTSPAFTRTGANDGACCRNTSPARFANRANLSAVGG